MRMDPAAGAASPRQMPESQRVVREIDIRCTAPGIALNRHSRLAFAGYLLASGSASVTSEIEEYCPEYTVQVTLHGNVYVFATTADDVVTAVTTGEIRDPETEPFAGPFLGRHRSFSGALHWLDQVLDVAGPPPMRRLFAEATIQVIRRLRRSGHPSR